MDATPSANDNAVRTLYHHLLRGWNSRDAEAFAALFTEDGSIIGFDGSIIDGRREIASQIGAIFASHQTPAYIAKIRSVRLLSAEVALLRAIVGMPTLMPSLINSTLNSIQTLVAHKRDGVWQVAHFQNTPAQFHGRPDLVAQMTEELQRLLDEGTMPR
jgi:uncharacterized protein (TIGR02246 family)